MKIVVDRNNPCVEEAFRQFGEVAALPTAEITPANIRDADALVVRSETRVDRNLLEGSRVRFVATATIGTDHIDLEYLRQRRIGFANAPGSNAQSVAEYLLAGLLVLGRRFGFALRGRTLGVVGVGNVGSRVVRIGETLGMRVLQNDPPLARSTGGKQFVPLDDLMESDIVTLHVPLTREGEDATYHLFDADRIGRMKHGSILINTARGSVVDSHALREALGSGHLAAAMLDVWEHEPSIDVELLKMTAVATSHIAGYSFDGKLNAVRMTYNAVCDFFRQERRWKGPAELPPPKVDHISLEAIGASSPEEILREIVLRCYDIEEDDRALRRLGDLPPEERSAYFRKLRAEYPVRREFAATSVSVPPDAAWLRHVLAAVGFSP